ncbi:MAG: hypothetical protein ABH952_07360 [Candidatus Omnitrophota bacterium]
MKNNLLGADKGLKIILTACLGILTEILYAACVIFILMFIFIFAIKNFLCF